MRRVVVLGASGFLGGHVRDRMRAAGYDVWTASRSGTGPGDARLDLTAPVDDLVAYLRAARPRVVVNASGLTRGRDCELVAANVLAVRHLLDALDLAAPEATLVHLGSAAEYGAQPAAVSEETVAVPLALYGVTKLASTELVVDAVRRRGARAVVLRIFNPIGPRTPRTTLFGELTARMREAPVGATITVGDLSGYRDLVDARDVADAVLAAATHVGELPPVLNVAGGVAVSLREAAERLTRVGGKEQRLAETAGVVSERSAAVSWQCAEIGAIAHALGWKPEIDVETSLHDMWESQR